MAHFVFDATVGTATANSYATVVEADDYFHSFLTISEWENLDDSKKELLLTSATRILDLLYYAGYVNSEEQALEWPRFDVTNRRGYFMDAEIIPALLKEATFEMAIYLLQNGIRYYNEDKDAENITGMSLGGNLTMTYDKLKGGVDKLPESVKVRLNQLGHGVWKSSTAPIRIRL